MPSRDRDCRARGLCASHGGPRHHRQTLVAGARRRAGRDAAVTAMDPVIDGFLDALWLEDGLSRNTLAAYRRDLAGLARWLVTRNQQLLSAGETDLTAYFAHEHAKTRGATANRRLAVLRRFFRWALRERVVTSDPTIRMRGARRAPRFPNTLNETQVEALLRAPEVDSALGLRDRAMLELLDAIGLRVSELVGLKLAELSLSEGLVRVIGKGSKERIVPLGEEARVWVERYLRRSRSQLLARRVSDAVFVTQRGGAMT